MTEREEIFLELIEEFLEEKSDLEKAFMCLNYINAWRW